MAIAINYLPEQLIFNILSFLPVISLLRCKSVCKYWLSIISNPQFIQTHLNISNTKQPSLAFLLATEADPLVSIISGECTSSINLPPQFKGVIQFIGYCNGLVCLGDFFNKVIYVWNHSIKRFKMLPKPKKSTSTSPVKLGFGYDFVANDYKFLRILCSNVSHVVEAELYSYNADSWKEIQLPKAVQCVWPFLNLNRVHAISGVLYLVGIDALVSFDLHNEVFEVYPYPDSVQRSAKLPFLDFEGSVAMIFRTAGDGCGYSLWTLDDVCGKVCWTKKFNLEPDKEMDRVDLDLGVGQFVALDYHVGFFLYDLMKKETEKLIFPVHDTMVLSAFQNATTILSAVKYTESLVSLEGFEQIE